MTTDTQIAVIGGGAAGLVAAISAAQQGCDVLIIEKGERLGKRILATGNGRCNLSNIALGAEVGLSAYNNPDFVSSILTQLDYPAIADFFSRLGLMISVDSEGRAYPRTNSANSVLDVLYNSISSLSIRERTGFEVRQVVIEQPGIEPLFRLLTERGESLTAQAIILATGPDVMPLLDIDLDRVWREPVLGPLYTEVAPLKGLNGIRVRCAASLLQGGKVVATEKGELLFRDYGLSGIMMFDLSRFLLPEQEISLDYFTDYSEIELLETMNQRMRQMAGQSATRFFDGMLQRRLAQAILRQLGYSQSAPAESMHVEKLVRMLKDHRFKIISGPTQVQAQVMRGGLATRNFTPQTLECLRQPRLYAVGEALDIDGRSGGFNLHWAWASGIAAGKAAAAEMSADR